MMLRWFMSNSMGGILAFVVIACAGCAGGPLSKSAVGIAQVPPEANKYVVTALTSAGYAIVGQPAWVGADASWRPSAHYRVFFSASVQGESADIFSSDLQVDSAGRVGDPERITRLSDTPAGDETGPVLAGAWLAYATSAGGRYQAVTLVPLADLKHQAVFVFDKPSEQVTLTWETGSASAESRRHHTRSGK